MIVDESLEIPDRELEFAFARSRGPGGQNVNKVNTKVLLRFDVAHSESLTAQQKALILARLANRIDGDGVLHLAAQEHRSQERNREAAVARLADLLARALLKPRPRRPTRVSRSAVEKRLEGKRRQGQKKKARARTPED